MAGRRRRPLTGISGLLLFVCMFVPAVKSCGESVVIPVSIPPVIPPYLLGLGFGLAGLFASAASRKGWSTYLRVVLILFLVECLVAIGEEPSFGFGVVVAPIAMLAILGLRGESERRLAGASIACGVASAIWFGLWCSSKDALIGVWLSLFSSIGLVIDGVAWLATPVDPNESDLPSARVISSRE